MIGLSTTTTTTTTTTLFLDDNRQITSRDYPQIAKQIEAGGMETYHLHLNYIINTKKVSR